MIPRRDFLLGTIASSVFMSQTRAGFAAEEEIRIILRDRVDNARLSTGIVASSFDSSRQNIATYLRSRAPNHRPLDCDTVFEIGSITKVFTAVPLAELATRDEVEMDDPIPKYI